MIIAIDTGGTKTLLARFKQKNPQTKNILATYEWGIKFDDEKIAYINQQLITTNFTAGQVKRLVEILSFSKLEVAKKLYDYCIDPQNYFVVFDAFSFSDEKNALSDYITKQIH